MARTKLGMRILIRKFDADIKKRSRFFRLLFAIDQLGNVLFLNGSQDETISSNIGRTGKMKWLCNILKRFQNNHCKRSIGE